MTTFTFACTPSDMHPYNCDGPGHCIHCDRGRTEKHNPDRCVLCFEQPAAKETEVTFTTHDIALIAIAIALWVYVLFGANLSGTWPSPSTKPPSPSTSSGRTATPPPKPSGSSPHPACSDPVFFEADERD